MAEGHPISDSEMGWHPISESVTAVSLPSSGLLSGPQVFPEELVVRRVPEPPRARLHRVARLGEFQLSRFAHVKSEHDEWAPPARPPGCRYSPWASPAGRRRPPSAGPAAAAVRLSQRRVRFIDGDELRLGRPAGRQRTRVGAWATWSGRVGAGSEWASGRGSECGRVVSVRSSSSYVLRLVEVRVTF